MASYFFEWCQRISKNWELDSYDPRNGQTTVICKVSKFVITHWEKFGTIHLKSPKIKEQTFISSANDFEGVFKILSNLDQYLQPENTLAALVRYYISELDEERNYLISKITAAVKEMTVSQLQDLHYHLPYHLS